MDLIREPLPEIYCCNFGRMVIQIWIDSKHYLHGFSFASTPARGEALLSTHEERCSLPSINFSHVFNRSISNEDQFMHNATAKERGYNVGVGIGFGGDICQYPFDPQFREF